MNCRRTRSIEGPVKDPCGLTRAHTHIHFYLKGNVRRRNIYDSISHSRLQLMPFLSVSLCCVYCFLPKATLKAGTSCAEGPEGPKTTHAFLRTTLKVGADLLLVQAFIVCVNVHNGLVHLDCIGRYTCLFNR